jgi:hypothetical protein
MDAMITPSTAHQSNRLSACRGDGEPSNCHEFGVFDADGGFIRTTVAISRENNTVRRRGRIGLYNDSIRFRRAGKVVFLNDKLFTINPALDSHGVARVCGVYGRLNCAVARISAVASGILVIDVQHSGWLLSRGRRQHQKDCHQQEQYAYSILHQHGLSVLPIMQQCGAVAGSRPNRFRWWMIPS